MELIGHLTRGEFLTKNREEVVGFAAQAQQEHLVEDSHNYQTWLEGAMVKGMRPLYKAIRSQELVLVRPFRDKEAALRPSVLSMVPNLGQSRSAYRGNLT